MAVRALLTATYVGVVLAGKPAAAQASYLSMKVIMDCTTIACWFAAVLGWGVGKCGKVLVHDRRDVETAEETFAANAAPPSVLVVNEGVVADQDLLRIEVPVVALGIVVQIEDRVLDKIRLDG